MRFKTRHGQSSQGGSRVATRTYRSWAQMRSRCRNPRHHAYADYGGRGITVCDRWAVFENFLADMGERPEGRTLDRIDNSKGYEPGNCRWATTGQQRRNSRQNRLISYQGSVMPLVDWAARVGLHPDTLGDRLKAGWSIDAAFTLPVNRGNRWRARKAQP